MKVRIVESVLITDGVKVVWSDKVEFEFIADDKLTLVGYTYDPDRLAEAWDFDEMSRREIISRTSAQVTLLGVGV